MSFVTAASLCVPPAETPASGKDNVPGKDASVKCFDAVLGKVRLPRLRFITVRKVIGRWILASTLSYCVCDILT